MSLQPSWRSAALPERIAGVFATAAAWVQGLSGWHRRGLAVLAGVLATAALPPVHAFPLLFLVFPVLIWLIDGTRGAGTAFSVGFWFGLGHFAAGTYWIIYALLIDPWKFAWMIPFIIGGLAAILAVFTGLSAMLARLFWSDGPARVLTLAIFWTAMEWLRSWVFTGFPWNLIGYSWAFSDEMNQFAAIGGIWGLSLVTVMAAGMPAVLARRTPQATAGLAAGPPASKKWVTPAVVVLLLLPAIWVGGSLRLARAETRFVPGVEIRLVQAGINQYLKGRRDMAMANFARHLALTIDTPGFDRITHPIWPETATPFLLERDPELREALATATKPGGVLITGAPRGEPATGELQSVWNSLVAVDGAGQIVATFDKFHLVPLGEYVPLRSVFPFINKITPGSTDFSSGPGPQTLRLPGLPPVSPLICYEVIFPGGVVNAADRPSWLLNLTNDGWFGISSGPYQHFASARLRAVEEGLPLVRAANTGISGVVDPFGRVVNRLGLGKVGVLDVRLPEPLPRATLFARYRDWTLAVLLAMATLATMFLRRAS